MVPVMATETACPPRAWLKRALAATRGCLQARTSTDLMIRLDNISKQNGHHLLFIDASMGIQKGEKVGLVGPNGAGKTTVFRMMAGQDRPDDGQVSIEA